MKLSHSAMTLTKKKITVLAFQTAVSPTTSTVRN